MPPAGESPAPGGPSPSGSGFDAAVAAEGLVEAIERDLNGRSGFHMSDLPLDILREMRGELAAVCLPHIEAAFEAGGVELRATVERMYGAAKKLFDAEDAYENDQCDDNGYAVADARDDMADLVAELERKP